MKTRSRSHASKPPLPSAPIPHRHDLAVSLTVLSLGQCSKEVSRLRARQARSQKSVSGSVVADDKSSHTMSHRLELLESLNPPTRQEEKDVQEASVLLDGDDQDLEDAQGDGPPQDDKPSQDEPMQGESPAPPPAQSATVQVVAQDQQMSSVPDGAHPPHNSDASRATSSGSTPHKFVVTKQMQREGTASLRLKELDADKLADSLEAEAKGRCYDHLIGFSPPSADDDGSAKDRFVKFENLLQAGLQRGKTQRSLSAGRPGPVEACMAALVKAVTAAKAKKVGKTQRAMEADIEKALVRLLNATVDCFASQTPSEQDGSTWNIGLPGHGSAVCAKHSTTLLCQTNSKVPLREKPDIVGLVAAQDITPSWYANTVDVCTWIEVKRYASSDLSRDLFRQVLRYAYSRVVSSDAVGFSSGLTMCGRLLRVWRFDALGYTTSRALDILEADDLHEIASVLAFVTGPSTLLTNQWKPVPNTDYVFEMGRTNDDHSGPAYIRVKFKEAPQELTDPSFAGLFGRRTTVWGGTAASLETGSIRNGHFVRDTRPPRFNVSVVVKTAWLPEYLKWHEHRVLVRLEEKQVPNVPRSLGLLQGDGVTLPQPTQQRHINHPHAQSDRIESRAVQLHLCVMLQDIELGIIMPVTTEDFGREARMCMLWAVIRILLDVSNAGVHYRDVNRGNILLKRDWQERLKRKDRNIAILIDFGNSRIEDQRRGDVNSPFVKDLPISVDDAMSVNELFMTTNAMACAAIQSNRLFYLEQIRKGVRVARNTTRLQEADDALASRDHRYVDDIEALFWCWLYHNVLNPRAAWTWKEELDKAIFEKNTAPHLWHDEGTFEKKVLEPQSSAAVIDEDVFDVLEKIRAVTYQAQEEHRKPENAHLRTASITSREQETYRFCLDALDEWIKPREDKHMASSVSANTTRAAAVRSGSAQQGESAEVAKVLPNAVRGRKSGVSLAALGGQGNRSPQGEPSIESGHTSSDPTTSPWRAQNSLTASHTPKTPSNLRFMETSEAIDSDQAGAEAGKASDLPIADMVPGSPESPTKRGAPTPSQLTTAAIAPTLRHAPSDAAIFASGQASPHKRGQADGMAGPSGSRRTSPLRASPVGLPSSSPPSLPAPIQGNDASGSGGAARGRKKAAAAIVPRRNPRRRSRDEESRTQPGPSSQNKKSRR